MVKSLVRRARHLGHVFRQAREAQRLTGRPVAAQLRELAALRRATGMNAREYFLYELYRPELSQGDKRQYLTRALHERYLAPLDPPEYGALLFDKAIFKRCFRAAGLPTADSFGVFHPTIGRTEGGTPLKTVGDLSAFLAELPADGLVVKPVRGGCGTDVLVFRHRGTDRTTLVHVNGRQFPIEQLAQRLRVDSPWTHAGYLVEELISQHPEVGRLNPATLNTLRAVTLIDRQGATRIVGATLKIGLDDSGVDSLVEEHLCAAVDWPIGQVGPAWMRRGIEFVRTDRHPVSGQVIEGFTLPDWRRVQAVVEQAAQTVPQLRSVGWDIGFSAQGPVVIEGNEIWGEEILQIPQRRGLWTPAFRELLE